jgi:hypothetical protein
MFAGLGLAGAGQNPTHYLPIGIAPECNSSHCLPSEGVDLRFGLALVSRQCHPLTDDLSAFRCSGFMTTSCRKSRLSPRPRRLLAK